jgi:hypothetical protein
MYLFSTYIVHFVSHLYPSYTAITDLDFFYAVGKSRSDGDIPKMRPRGVTKAGSVRLLWTRRVDCIFHF